MRTLRALGAHALTILRALFPKPVSASAHAGWGAFVSAVLVNVTSCSPWFAIPIGFAGGVFWEVWSGWGTRRTERWRPVPLDLLPCALGGALAALLIGIGAL